MSVISISYSVLHDYNLRATSDYDTIGLYHSLVHLTHSVKAASKEADDQGQMRSALRKDTCHNRDLTNKLCDANTLPRRLTTPLTNTLANAKIPPIWQTPTFRDPFFQITYKPILVSLDIFKHA